MQRSRGAMASEFVKRRCQTARSRWAERGTRCTIIPSFVAAPGFTSLSPATKERIRKRNAGRRSVSCPAPAGAVARHGEGRLAPTRPLSGALACRRSTTALARGTLVPRARPGPGFVGRGAKRCGRSPPTPVPVPASTSHAGHSAGRLMPEPPGSAADEAAPAGTALAPTFRSISRRRPYRARFDS